MNGYCIYIFAAATIIIHLSPEYLERSVWVKTRTIRGKTHDRIGHFQLQSETGSTLCRIVGLIWGKYHFPSFIDDYEVARETEAAFLPKPIPWCNLTQLH